MPFLIKLLVLAVVFQQYIEQGNSGMVANISKKRQKEIIDQHNAVRAGVKPTASNMMKMRWDEEASESAKKWAAQCRARTSPADQRVVDGVHCGEIILTSYKPVTWTKIIQDWSATSVNFEYGQGPISDINLSDVYTQLVWHNSHRVGCATAHCPEQIVPFLYVCHYCPLGNIVRLLPTPYKEGKPCADCPDNCENNLCTNPCIYVDHIEGCEKLLQMSNCDAVLMQKNCQATCKCKSNIN